MPGAPRAIIAGAGVAGLGAAIALARSGRGSIVLERAPTIEEVGAGLQIPPNASAVLREWGVLDRLARTALEPEALRMRSAGSGASLMRLPLGPVGSLRWGAPYLVAHRADLIEALLEQAASEPLVELQTGTEIVGFASSEKGVEAAVRRGDDSDRVEGGLLIGADGLRSSVRRKLGLGADDEPIWSGSTAWRALIDARDAPTHALRLETCVWLGSRAHLVHYPLRGGDLINVVAVVDDGWRGGADQPDLWSIAGDFASIRRFFAGWHKDAKNLLEAASVWRRWPLYDRRPATRWTDRRVTLAGDAAHPMMPFLAQGAAQAIEDGQALAAALSANESRVEAGLLAYEARRMPRAGAVQLASRRQGAIWNLGGPAAFARDMILSRMGFQRMMKQLDWLYRPS